MFAKTRYFGDIDIDEDKIVTLDRGLLGFDEFKKFAIIYDIEKEEGGCIKWLQCMDEPDLALPIIDPLIIDPVYNPIVEDELLKGIGELTEDNMAVFITVTVPSDIKEMSVNMKAPIIINTDTKKGAQIIVENDEYEVRYKVYELLKSRKENEDASTGQEN